MSRTAWALPIAIYAIFALGVYLSGGGQVAPCLAGSGTAPDLQRRCAEAWFAHRSLELKLLDTPIPAVVLFVGLVAITVWVTRDRTRTSSQAD